MSLKLPRAIEAVTNPGVPFSRVWYDWHLYADDKLVALEAQIAAVEAAIPATEEFPLKFVHTDADPPTVTTSLTDYLVVAIRSSGLIDLYVNV